MAKAKKKPVAMRSRKSGKKKSIQIKKNNEILSRLKSENIIKQIISHLN